MFIVSCNNGPAINPTLNGYEERSQCYSCHEEVYKKYVGSHHDLAMEIATEESVLGNFDNFTMVHLGDAVRFYKKDDNFFVYTKGVDGEYSDFEVKYTFGWTPLQQYLIEFPRGCFQVLPYCWDSQSEEEGGQRWFHIYNQEKIPHDDVLYWTKKQQNWNHVCAECHSTNLKKNYNLATLNFSTDWKEIDVSCDACHGPSQNHLKWAELDEKGKETKKYPNMGYAFNFPNDSASWEFDMEKGTAFRSKPRQNRQEVELCARCHSRRTQIWGDYVHGESLMQTHLPDLLVPRLYHVDGQIKEEDYVYNSFLQSKMYMQGVTCTDCHDAHSMQIQAPGNLLCSKCHVYSKYNNYTHHFHDADSTGGSCKDCHMAQTTYMVVDPRQDHSIRIPRPDLSLKLGTPNSCTQCHTDETDQWAASWFRKWYGDKYDTITHFGEVFYSALHYEPEALNDLISIVNDNAQPPIVRASALKYMEYYPAMGTVKQLEKHTNDTSPMVRMAAIQTLSQLNGEQSVSYAIKLLNDSVRAVRYEAALAYSKVSYNKKSDLVRNSHRESLKEYIQMLLVNNDQAATYVNMGIYYLNESKTDSALICYENALKVDSTSVEASINIADVYRIRNHDDKGEQVLLNSLKINPDRPELYHALGLLYTRKGQTQKALEMFNKSVKLEPENTYYIYVLGVALNSLGNSKEAILILEKGYEINPFNYNILYTLSAIYRDLGDMDNFNKYYETMVKLQNEMN